MEKPIITMSYISDEKNLSVTFTLSGSHVSHVASAMISMLRAMGYTDAAIVRYVDEVMTPLKLIQTSA